MTAPLASDDLVERIAAALHTLVRGWHYDPDDDAERRARRGGELILDPWVVATNDADWVARGEQTVDLAATWWEDLPADWHERFLGLGRDAGDAVIAAAQSGRTPIDMAHDDAFLEQIGALIRRDWLAVPRVIALEGGVVDRGRAGTECARVAVYLYAEQLVGGGGTIGSVPSKLPSDRPDPSTLVKVGGHRPLDHKYVSFSLYGDRLSGEHRAALTALFGHPPDASFSRGALHLQPSTGRQYRPRRTGHWSLSSQGEVPEQGTTLEDHVLWLLRILEPGRRELLELIADHDLQARFGCFYSQTACNAEWELSARTIERIAALGAAFWFDSYYSGGDEDDDEDEA